MEILDNPVCVASGPLHAEGFRPEYKADREGE